MSCRAKAYAKKIIGVSQFEAVAQCPFCPFTASCPCSVVPREGHICVNILPPHGTAQTRALLVKEQKFSLCNGLKWTKSDASKAIPGDGKFEKVVDGNKLEIDYKEGVPNFETAKLNGERVTWPGPDNDPNFMPKVDIPAMKGTRGDFEQADAMMARKLGVTDWNRPKGYTWHHGTDGTSMTLVKSEAHHAQKGGGWPVPGHEGGNAQSKLY